MTHIKDTLARQDRLSPSRRALLDMLKRGEYQHSSDTERIPARTLHQEERIPLSFAQQRLWFLNKLETGHPFYNVYVAFRLTGFLQYQALQRSLQALVQRHEILRTTFHEQDGQPVQVIATIGQCALPLVTVAALSSTVQQEVCLQLARDEALSPFDLTRGPLLRAVLLRKNEEEHILLITMHHIICDGWSMGIFMHELALYYNAFVMNEAVVLPALAIQYADYALWQREQMQGDRLATQIRYWRERLADMPVELELPIDHQRPSTQRYQGEALPVRLPRTLSRALKRFSQEEGTTLFMVLLAAFKVLLMRYSGQRDIVVGTDITDRSRVETESIMGFCVNTLVSRTKLTGNPSFRALLARVHTETLRDFAYRDMPFDVLVADLQPERHLSRSAVVQVMFDLQDTQVMDAPLTGLTMERLFIDGKTAKFDLLFDLLDANEELRGTVEYNTGIFEQETIVRLLQYWHILLEQIVMQPDLPITALPLLSESERQKMLVEWNNLSTRYPVQKHFQTLFAAQVGATEDRIAVVSQEHHLTYMQLDKQANQLAHYLSRAGVGPEVLVGIYLERSFAMLIAMLAIFKTGGAYVPLDLAYPRERLEQVLSETQARFVLTTENWRAFLSDIHPGVITLDTVWQECSRYSNEAPLVDYHSSNLAYVIYTSGSTGRPKGAMLTQEGMINHLFAKIDVLELSQNDRIVQMASLCFDISVWQFLTPLLCGGSVYIMSEEDVYTPSHLFRSLLNEDISTVELVPSHLRMLVEELEGSAIYVSEWMKLRWMISTGEAISPALCARWLDRIPHVPVINTYGATECSDDVTHSYTRHILPEQAINVAVGRPIEGMQVYVLDEQFDLVPVGGIGQIYMGGVGVGRGYMHDAVRTAEVFIPDPYSKEPGKRFYKTGDLGRYLADGQIECLGRTDQQVKVRGHRVEMSEIEIVLDQHPLLRECVVIDWENQPSDKQLVAYVVAKDSAALSTTMLRDYLQKKLPDYMIPAYFVWLEMLPLNANGKVDRRGLPAPDQLRSELDVASVPPRSVSEEIIAEIWSSLLNIDQVGIYDNFFTMGGHSLLAAQVVARIRTVFQVDIPLRLLFEQPTVDGLTSGIAQLIGGRDTLEEIALLFKEVDNLTEDEVIRLADESVH